MNLSPSAVNLWESGRTEPSATMLAELAVWFGVSTDWLLGVTSKTPQAQIKAPGTVTMLTVPVVDPKSLVTWSWDAVTELLQTNSSYPDRTAAAIQVTTDSLASVCPVGSYAVISKGVALTSGQLVLATVGKSTEPVLRRYVREGDEGLLIADDVRYPSYRMADGVKIIGAVVEVVIRRSLT